VRQTGTGGSGRVAILGDHSIDGNWATLLHNVVSSISGHERGSNFIVVINTDCTSSCKSNYRMLMTKTVLNKYVRMAKLPMQCHMFTKCVFDNFLLCQQVKKILKQDTKNISLKVALNHHNYNLTALYNP
jgi:hypothetical protein